MHVHMLLQCSMEWTVLQFISRL